MGHAEKPYFWGLEGVHFYELSYKMWFLLYYYELWCI